MAEAEKRERGKYWRARWRGPHGRRESQGGFASRKEALQYAKDQEATIRFNTYIDPRAGRITLTDWANRWYPGLDLELGTLSNYRYYIEVHILPAFGDLPLTSLTTESIARWEKETIARGYTPKVAREARSTLSGGSSGPNAPNGSGPRRSRPCCSPNAVRPCPALTPTS